MKHAEKLLIAACAVRDRGWWPVPLIDKSPEHLGGGWHNLRLDPHEQPQPFNGRANGIGVILGPSRLVDLEADNQASDLALEALAPPTDCVYKSPTGRRHWFYRSDAKHHEWRPPGAGKVELRAGNHQSAIPPSLHPEHKGKEYLWVKGGEPSEAPVRALHHACVLASIAGALAAARQSGNRHDLAGAAAGFLRRRGVTLDEAASVIDAVARAAGDDPKGDGLRYVQDTYARDADAPLTGLPTLAEMIGEKAANWIDRQLPEDSGNSVNSVNSVTKASDEWSSILPFASVSLPAFPIHALPDWMGRFVEAEAEATQTPPDLAGALVLAAGSVASARRFVVRVRPGWNEPSNLYVVVSLPSGERKSAVFDDVTAPIRDYEAGLREEAASELARVAAEREIIEGRALKAKNQAIKTGDDQDMEHAKNLAVEASEVFVSPVPRYLADDVTPEKLQTLLQQYGERMAILSDEGGVFDLMAGRYSQGGAPNFQVFLKGHTGNQLRVDRVTRPDEFLDRPALTLGLAVQPDVLRGLVGVPAFRGRGLLARFLYSIPTSKVGFRSIKPDPVSAAIKAEYRTRLRAMLAFPDPTEQRGISDAYLLYLDEDADAVLTDLEKRIEPKVAPFAELAHMRDWALKAAGAVVRMAAIIHLAHYSAPGEVPWEFPIDGHTMERAVVLGDYFIPHARAAFAEMGADPVIEDAKHVLSWLRRGDWERITKRDLFRGLQARFNRVEAMDPALRLLEQHSYIRRLSTERREGPGQMPSPVYQVHPDFVSRNGNEDS